MAKYAAKTEVPAERSRAEIESILVRYGANAFSYGWDDGRAVIQFRANERHIRFELVLPDPNSTDFTRYTDRYGYVKARSASAAQKEYEQAVRQKWRALVLVVKAKLEAIDAGISTFGQEFLAHIVLPDGSTVGHQVMPKIAAAYETGQMPRLLTTGTEEK